MPKIIFNLFLFSSERKYENDEWRADVCESSVRLSDKSSTKLVDNATGRASEVRRVESAQHSHEQEYSAASLRPIGSGLQEQRVRGPSLGIGERL